MTIRHVFVDMDGVLVDFVSAALDVHGQPQALAHWPPGEWEISKVLGISKSKFWQKIDAHGSNYWVSLQAYPWMQLLLQSVSQFAPFTILTSPSQHPQCLAGKVRWLQENLHGNFRDFLIGPQKYLCARPDTVLIDDSDHNIDLFRQHGGRGVLFPRHWNSNHTIDDPVEFVRQQLEQHCQER